MILPEDFAIKIDYDDVGLLIEVTHKPTEERRVARPSALESVHHAKNKLIAEIRSQFPKPEDFIVYWFCGLDLSGNPCTSYEVRHKASGKRRNTKNGDEIQIMMDEIATELWHEVREKGVGQENHEKARQIDV